MKLKGESLNEIPTFSFNEGNKYTWYPTQSIDYFFSSRTVKIFSVAVLIFLSCWVSPPSYDSLNSKQTNKIPGLSMGAGLEPGRSELASRWHRVFPSFSALSSHSLRRWHEFRVPAFSLWHLRDIKGIVMLPLRDQGGSTELAKGVHGISAN